MEKDKTIFIILDIDLEEYNKMLENSLARLSEKEYFELFSSFEPKYVKLIYDFLHDSNQLTKNEFVKINHISLKTFEKYLDKLKEFYVERE